MQGNLDESLSFIKINEDNLRSNMLLQATRRCLSHIKPANQESTKATCKPSIQQTNQPTNQPTNKQATHFKVSASALDVTRWFFDAPTPSKHQPTNRPSNQPTKQPTNQQTSQQTINPNNPTNPTNPASHQASYTCRHKNCCSRSWMRCVFCWAAFSVLHSVLV